MKNLFKGFIIALGLTLTAHSAGAKEKGWGEDHSITIWSNKNAPHSNGVKGKEIRKDSTILKNVSKAELLIYEAKGANGTKGTKGANKSDRAVVICPGGGYSALSMSNGGKLIAKWLAEEGITAAVLKYRLPNGVKEVPLEDAVEGLRLMREMGDKLGFDPEKVGILGLSAGGHLAAMASTMTEGDDRPAFSILFFPVISERAGLLASRTSYNNLLGKDRSEELTEEYSLDLRVSESTPPALLFHSNDDAGVSSLNSTLYYNALSRYNKHSSLYIFPNGGHGWGFSDRVDFKPIWQELLLNWVDQLYKENN